MSRELMHPGFRLVSVAAVGLLLATTSGCLVATETETEGDLGEVASPIFDGTAATKDEIFSTVALRRLGHDDYMCTGTLIAPSVVVTAAHCLTDEDQITGEIIIRYDPMEMTVVAGALDARVATEDQRFAITKIVPHPKYTGSSKVGMDGLGEDNDIAILLLQQPLTSLPSVPVLSLDQFKSNLSQGKLVTIPGYGFHDAAAVADGQLYLAQAPYQRHNATEILVGVQGSPKICEGDTGGPIYLSVEGTLYDTGVASRDALTAGAKCVSGDARYALLPAYDSFLRDAAAGAYPPPRSSSDSSGLPNCTCKLERAPTSSGSSLWLGLGIALLVARRRRATTARTSW
jgi:secreted trypsin-like serine protease